MPVEAFYAVYYQGAVGQGMGMVVFETQRIIGADITGGQWDGTYEYDVKTDEYAIKVNITFRGGTFSAVTGAGSEAPFTEEYSLRLPKNISDGYQMRLETSAGPLQVVFKKLRDLDTL